MATLAAVLGFSSVSAKLFKFAQRVHGQTLARFAALLALNDLVINKHITVLSTAVAEFLETGSRHAGTSAWKSVRALEDALKRLPPAEQEAVAYDLERYVQMLLSQDADLAKLIGKDIEEFSLLRLRRLATRALEESSKEARVIAAWKRGAHGAGGDLLKIFKRFEKLVSLDDPAVVKASAYIRDHADSLREAIRAARNGDKAPLLGHLSSIRGLLGEAYALLSPVWRARHRATLKEAKKLARKLGRDYEVLAISQLKNKIFLSGKEGADQMILIVNRTKKPPEAITFLSAQVKTADKSEAIAQTLNDVFTRELNPAGLLECVVGKQQEVFKLVQHEAVTAQRYILNAAESYIPPTDLALLRKKGVQVSEVVLDMSVSQFSVLAIQMIEDGLNALKKATAAVSQ
jgi:hypothetical protein